VKGKEARPLLRDFQERFPASRQVLDSGNQFEELSVEDGTILFVDGKPLILRTKHGLVPSLKFNEVINVLPKIVVDMGAVAHLANGAHLMRPGIREIRGEFRRGDIVAIVDEKFGKAVALGTADFDSASMRALSKGKVVVNVHFAGDAYWRSFSS